MGQRNLFYSVMAPFSCPEYLFYFPSCYRFVSRYRFSSFHQRCCCRTFGSILLILIGQHWYWKEPWDILGLFPAALFHLVHSSFWRMLLACYSRKEYRSYRDTRYALSLRLMKCRWLITDPKYQIVVAVTRIVLTCYFEVCLEVYSNYIKTISQRRNDIEILINALLDSDNQNYKFYITNLSPVEYFNSTDALAIFTSRILLGS